MGVHSSGALSIVTPATTRCERSLIGVAKSKAILLRNPKKKSPNFWKSLHKEAVFRLGKKFGSFLFVRFSVFDAPSHQKTITKEKPQVRANLMGFITRWGVQVVCVKIFGDRIAIFFFLKFN